jgi:hypothetical protein
MIYRSCAQLAHSSSRPPRIWKPPSILARRRKKKKKLWFTQEHQFHSFAFSDVGHHDDERKPHLLALGHQVTRLAQLSAHPHLLSPLPSLANSKPQFSHSAANYGSKLRIKALWIRVLR